MNRDELIELLSKWSGVPSDQITDETQLGADLGLNSLQRVELVIALESAGAPEAADDLHDVSDVVAHLGLS
jgi:acyl carrier protein